MALMGVCTASAQTKEQSSEEGAIVTNSFWDNWYGQVGADMILFFPVHHSVKNVFPNGKSLGLSVAVGKWFSPEIGGKFKFNWNNAIIKETHNVWYHPYGVKGGSHHHGGFMTFNGAIQFNAFNLFDVYKPERKWDLIFDVRGGAWMNVREGKCGPTLGAGITNTYRLNDKWRLFADASYSFVTSLNGIESGTDHGGNSYAELNVGVEMNLSKKNKFHTASEQSVHDAKAAVLNGFWDNWFAQAGLGMSLQNPYGTNFSNVFPNGNTLGINLGLGKWFTPEVGLRAGVNWQNGIIKNDHAYYLASYEDPRGKLDKRGFFSLYVDMFFNLHHIVEGYSENRKWNAIIFPRMGLATNFTSSYSECPILGIGTEHTYAINDHLKLYADVAYQIITSGFHDKKSKTPEIGISSNGFFDFNVGVQIELGKKTTWKRVKE